MGGLGGVLEGLSALGGVREGSWPDLGRILVPTWPDSGPESGAQMDQNRFINGPQNQSLHGSLFSSILGPKNDKKDPKLIKKRGQKHDVYEWFLSRFCMHLWMDDSTISIQHIT